MKGEIYGVGCEEESTACLSCVSLFSLGLLGGVGTAGGEDWGGDDRLWKGAKLCVSRFWWFRLMIESANEVPV